MTNKFLGVFEWYEAIGKWLVENAPEPWEKIVIDFQIEEIDDVCEYCIVYFPLGSSKTEKQFFLHDTNFFDCFYQLARFTSTPEKGLCRKSKFTLNKDGRYETDFEY